MTQPSREWWAPCLRPFHPNSLDGPLLTLPSRPPIERNGPEDRQSHEHELPESADADHRQAVPKDGKEQGSQEGANDRAASAPQTCSANDDGSEYREQERQARARVGRT